MTPHVLLIEDEANIAEALRFILTRDGWRVSHLAAGTDAVATVQTLTPDLVILDLMLPGRSGFDILKDLRAGPETRNLPILMLTAKNQSHDRDAALQAGASLFMAKPFANDDILRACRALVPR
jgi:DNA-binding response OmpR family regulator